MAQQPHRNEERFYRYPMKRVAAIIDDGQHLSDALRHLEEAGVDMSGVHVLSGPDGARLLDSSGRRSGLYARILRLLQRTAYEGETLSRHEQALKSGGNVIYVPVGSEDERARVVRVLRNAGGHYLLHFHRWTVEELRF
jgi:hypothetical protein